MLGTDARAVNWRPTLDDPNSTEESEPLETSGEGAGETAGKTAGETPEGASGEGPDETKEGSVIEETDSIGKGESGSGVVAFDLTASSGLGESETDAVLALHKGAAAEMETSISGVIGTEAGVVLTSVTQQTYREFRDSLPAGTYMATNTIRPLGEDLGICIEPELALLLVDLLLGGSGSVGEVRELTAIEAQVLEKVVGDIARAIQAAWQPVLDQAFVFGRRIPAAELDGFMPPADQPLLVSFEVSLADSTGKVSVVLSPVMSNALLRKLAATTGAASRPDRSGVSDRLGHHILNTPFEVEVLLPDAPVPARNLIGLKAGDVLSLPHSIDDPAIIVVAGRPMLTGVPVRYEMARAVEVVERQSSGGDVRKEEV